jgi:lysyl-tRNA synthetase class 2
LWSPIWAEIAQRYHELLDASVLRQRFQKLNQERVAAGKPALPVESRLIRAMEAGLPACCGVALGFDRLAMIAVEAASIDEVLAFPAERA